ncbi:hypothetical protein HAX54_030551 [Datura stramonium]|uniref:Uncharacterized protein n=1 Tax=Datura stramonium TaxID=4076 RepID=A0ABS8VAQ6_DATST|nr:hypothetical protein [Datura stramonium]
MGVGFGLHFHPFSQSSIWVSVPDLQMDRIRVVPELVDHDHNPLPRQSIILAESEEIGFFSGSWYEREDMCDTPANSSIGWRDKIHIHDVVMLNLEKGKKYYYQVGSDSGAGAPFYSLCHRMETRVKHLLSCLETWALLHHTWPFLRTQEEKFHTMYALETMNMIGRFNLGSLIGQAMGKNKYERFCPLNSTCGSMVLNGEERKSFPVQVVIGMAGQDWQPIPGAKGGHLAILYPQPLQSVQRE